MSRFVKIQEVGPRDGLQNEKTILDTYQRVRLIRLLIDSGLKRIQVGSFVNPKLVPQMAHTDEVLNLLEKHEEIRFSVLVLNERGLTSAIQAGARHVEVFVSASETHSQKNTGMSQDKALKSARRMISTATAAGLTVTAGVMCAFGCEFEGKIETDAVIRIVFDLMELMPDELGLADTTGQGNPDLVERTIQKISGQVPVEKISLHLHDTYGRAEDNLLRALDIGVQMFDSSIGGLGGCPFIPGAAGNISTEKVVQLLNGEGVITGVDLNRLSEARSLASSLLRTEL